MPTKLIDFREIGRKILFNKKLENEISYRTAINRFYYGIFLEFRELIKHILSKTDKNLYRAYMTWYKKGAIHSKIKRILDQIDKKTSSLFGKLQQLRRLSDYNIETEINRSDAENALAIITILDQQSKTVLNRLTDPRKRNKIKRILK